MDDTAQNQNAGNVGDVQNQVNDATQEQTIAAPISPSLNREREFIKPSEPETILKPEIKEAGVEVVSEKPNLDKIHEQIGVKHSGENVPVPKKPTSAIKLPIPEEKARIDAKGGLSDFDLREISEDHDSVLPSSRFLGTLITKVLDRLKSFFK